MHVLLYTIGSVGDVLPFVRVGAALVRAGHKVTLLTHHGYQDAAANAGISYEPIDTQNQYQEFLSSVALLNTPSKMPEFFTEHVFPFVPAALALLEAHAIGNDIVVTPALYDIVPRLAHEKLGVCPLWLCVSPIQAKATALQRTLFGQVLNDEIDQVRAQVGLGPVASWDRWLAHTSPALALWPPWFGAPETGWMTGLTPVGFAVDTPPRLPSLSTPLRQFLNDHPSPTLVTGGTGAFHGRKFYAAALDAAASSGQAVIVVTRFPEHLPKVFSENVLVIDHAPFSSLLPETGLIVHHGGIGTTAAAIAAGIPQLILAYGLDRPDNGARIQSLGMGEVVPPPRWQPAELADAMLRLAGSAPVRAQCHKHALLVQQHNTEGAINDVFAQFLTDNPTEPDC